jgi:predicted lactoylglutathione lyase
LKDYGFENGAIKDATSVNTIGKSMSLNERAFTRDDKNALIDEWTNLPRSNIGPGTYETTKDFNKRTFRRNWNNVGFGKKGIRFQQLEAKDAKIRIFSEAMADVKLTKTRYNTFSQQNILLQRIQDKHINKVAFNSTEVKNKFLKNPIEEICARPLDAAREAGAWRIPIQHRADNHS